MLMLCEVDSFVFVNFHNGAYGNWSTISELLFVGVEHRLDEQNNQGFYMESKGMDRSNLF
jgi:hypothetical protein